MPAPRKYDPEILRRAVELVKSSGRPVAHIAAELGIGSESLRKAVRTAEAESGERPDLPAAAGERGTPPHERDPQARERIFRPGARPGAAERDVAVTFVEDHRYRYAVGLLCRAVGLHASTYYDHRPGGPRSRPCLRDVADAGLLERIEAIHERSRQTYGSPRVHAQLTLDGHRVGRKRVERLMREAGLQGVCLRRHWRTTIADPDATRAPDLVERDFTADAPNRLWVADFVRHEAP